MYKSTIEALSVQKESEREPDPAELRVSSSTNPNKLSFSIIEKLRKYGYAQIRAIGAPAIKNAMFGYTVARSKLVANGVDAICYTSFFSVIIESEDGEKTLPGLLVTVENR